MAAPRSTSQRLALCALLLVVTGSVFAPTTGYEFVGFDDERYVVRNADLHRGLDAQVVRFAFTSLEFSNWHPLTWLSFAADVELHGLDPGGFHTTNLILHLAAVVLVFLLFERWTGALWPSAGLAALFAWHPLHVEPVAWVSERKELLAAVFGFLAMACHARFAKSGNRLAYAGTALCLALSLMSKPMWVTLPLLLLALDHWPLGRLTEAPVRRTLEKLPLLALSAASSAVTLLVQRTAFESGSSLGWGDRVANALVSFLAYLGQTLWPARLSVLYPHPALNAGPGLSGADVAIAAAGCLALAGLAWRLRRHAYVPAGLAWYAIALVPVIGLVQVGEQARADRYTYVPLLGIFWIASFGSGGAIAALAKRTRPLAIAVCAAAAIVLAALAWRSADQVTAWRDTITLYERSLASTPNSPILRHNLGNRLLARGDTALALPHYEAAIALRPDWSSPRVSLAWLLATTWNPDLRDTERALALAERAVSLESPVSANTLDTLAAAQAAAGDFAAARTTAERASAQALRDGHPNRARVYARRAQEYAEGRAYRESPPPGASSTSKSQVR